jgi:hypothetical protein
MLSRFRLREFSAELDGSDSEINHSFLNIVAFGHA